MRDYLNAAWRYFKFMATSWWSLGDWAHNVVDDLREFWNGLVAIAWAMLSLTVLLSGPLLALLTPVAAIFVVVNERRVERRNAEALRKAMQHYGSRHQRTEDDAGDV